MQFGSRIDRSAAKQNEEMHSVKEVLSPELLVLGNGLRVRLLGIATVPKFASEAIAYLETSTKGQKVFLKFDATKFDENDVLFGYVYLSNKTFLNAHLIKRGLVDADRKHIYKYKEKFINKIDGDRWPKNGS